MESNLIEKYIRKSELYAEGTLAYKQLCFPVPGFLKCTAEEEKEDVRFCYDTAGYRSFTELRREKKKDILCILLSISELEQTAEEYFFPLSPDNLFYDRCRRAAVMQRDLYERGSALNITGFFEQFRALTGYALQKHYQYEDYLIGGKDLFAKNKFLKKVGEKQSLREIIELLEQEYELIDKDEKENKMLVGKKWYGINRWYVIFSLLLLLAAGSYTIYEQGVTKPIKEAMLQASNSFAANDYLRIIDVLKEIKTDKIDDVQQYMLAVAYIKSENLTMEQKENILATITLGGDQKLIRYWIYLGRMELAEAENIAMQKSDDELLLYAYLKEKAVIETEQNLSGEEKAARLESLETKINNLSKKYNLEKQEE